uniref:NADH-ubiquinone oxidoreductase chain 2 n=1 Tax=Acrochordus granulatus TaxID=46287 RepID=Q402N0_ACRGR|nr:NADH dehydrogenase subunit 2 [Acrochordus granulatus]BAE20015.1 NADH dehydrogenase subunit 2 [Acrochordus granulatus]
MNPTSWLIITTSIFTSTILTSSSLHWLMAWACLEINTLSMIPVISKSYHPRSMEATTKYFLTQTLASMVMLMAATSNAMNTSNWEIQLTSDHTTTITITLALLMKMGAAPFHFWLPEVSQGTTTMTTLTILTWQKLAPLSILLSMSNKTNHTILIAAAMLSITIGGLGGLNQTQMRKLMAFSSITHTGWILSTMTISPEISTMTMLMYILITSPIMITLHLSSTSTIKDLGMMWTISPQLSSMLTITILSLSGLPPMTGFMPKWLILNKMISFNLTMEATTMALTSLLSTYMYMRLMYISSMTLHPYTITSPMKWRPSLKKHPMLPTTLMTLSTMILPLTPYM